MDKLLKNRKLWSAILIIILIFLGVFLYNDEEIHLPEINIFQDNGTDTYRTVAVQKPLCPDVANGMLRGRWKSRPISSEEETEMVAFLESARSEHGMPKSMQREDGMCGTISFENVHWFRALCNPKGPTPCCFGDRCVDLSSDLCECDDCYDLRTPIHAEYSTWIPEDPQCEVKNFTASDACELVHKTQLFMVGDSLMRHFYIGLLMTLRNNREGGAFPSDITKEIHDRCKGMFTFTEKSCRVYTIYGAKVCKESASVAMGEYYNLAHTRHFHKLAKALLHVKNTVLVVGIGFHESFSFKVYYKFILPVILMMKSQKAVWPRIIWSANHQFGILKSPYRPDQDNMHVEMFNKFMIEHLRQFKIPIFDTYNMTSGVMSQDGSHYGIGVNLMKAQMFLNFLQELRYNERW